MNLSAYELARLVDARIRDAIEVLVDVEPTASPFPRATST